jgi:tRNA 2-thiocytidine biosynthesis protein TtcA
VPKQSHTEKLLNRKLGRAMMRYRMVDDGDRIVLGLSGGKDSWTLLWLLNRLRLRAPIDFEIHPVFIDPGFEGGPADIIAEHGRRIGFDVRIEATDHGKVAHSAANRENPCFLCSRLRRQRLFEIADELGCRKLALAHNRDDLIETLFLNICYAGEISTMVPAQPFFGGKLTVIRPLAYVDEEAILAFSREMDWPIKENPCPSAGISKRAEMKDWLGRLYRHSPNIKGNIFHAMHHVKPDYLLNIIPDPEAQKA